jgi:hypothetical protein
MTAFLRQAPDHALDKGTVLVPAVEFVGLEGAEVSSTRERPNDLPARVLGNGDVVRSLNLIQEPAHVLKTHETEQGRLIPAPLVKVPGPVDHLEDGS